MGKAILIQVYERWEDKKRLIGELKVRLRDIFRETEFMLASEDPK
jgi:hypothetical protein